jgi:hypothetical protein
MPDFPAFQFAGFLVHREISYALASNWVVQKGGEIHPSQPMFEGCCFVPALAAIVANTDGNWKR